MDDKRLRQLRNLLHEFYVEVRGITEVENHDLINATELTGAFVTNVLFHQVKVNRDENGDITTTEGEGILVEREDEVLQITAFVGNVEYYITGNLTTHINGWTVNEVAIHIDRRAPMDDVQVYVPVAKMQDQPELFEILKELVENVEVEDGRSYAACFEPTIDYRRSRQGTASGEGSQKVPIQGVGSGERSD